jgi:hypothetical protein
MEKQLIDPLVYDEKTWPRLSMEEKRDAVAAFAGLLVRCYDEVIEERFGKENAREAIVEVWRRLLKNGVEATEEALGIKGLRDAVAFIKWNAHLEEEQLGCVATTLEAEPKLARRAVIKCPLGDNLRKDDCACIIEGAKRCVEDNYPGYTFSQESVYQETHMCIYKMEKK